MGAKRTLGSASGQGVDRDRILGKVVRYDAVRKEVTKLGKEKTDIATELKEAAIEFGNEDGRSHVLKIGSYSIANRASVSDDIDTEAALELLEKKGLLEECTKRVLDKEAVQQCVQSGEITVEELDSFMEESVSFKIEVKKLK